MITEREIDMTAKKTAKKPVLKKKPKKASAKKTAKPSASNSKSTRPTIYYLEIAGENYPAMRVADLLGREAEYNPRKISKHDKSALAKSMERFGTVQSVVYNERTNTVVGGHQRLDVAEASGLEIFPVMIVNLSLIEEKALNLSLNRISGEFVMQGVASLLNDIQGINSDYLDFTGFTGDEMSPLLVAQFEASEENLEGVAGGEGEIDGKSKGMTFDKFVEVARQFVDSPEPNSMSGKGEELKGQFHEAIRNAVDMLDGMNET